MPEERTTAASLAALGLDPPKVSGKSQAEVDAKLDEWKGGPLKKAWHAAAQQHHPDRNPGDEAAAARFKDAQASYEYLLNLRVRLRPPKTPTPPPGAKACPLGHTRIPSTAKFCHECGHPYGEDALVDLLRTAGITEKNIAFLRMSGELDTLRTLHGGSADLADRVRLLQQRQRLGLIGAHTGWK